MAKISLILILLLQTVASFAQNYFVFIGSEDRQPFYVRVDSEFHSSTPEGHLILSQLKDSTYNITIGFPGQTLSEQHYSFKIGGKDQEFQLQPQGQDGLRLYDLQKKDWLSLQGGGGRTDEFRTTGVKKDDAFSRMMAGVVHDTAVLYNTYAMEQALTDSPVTTRPDTAVAAIIRPDTTVAATTHPDTTVATTTHPDTAVTAMIKPESAVATIAKTDTIVTALNKPDTTVSTSLYRPIPAKDSTSTTNTNTTSTSNPATDTNSASTGTTTVPAPIPSTVGKPLYRSAAAVTKVSEHRSSRNVRLVYADHSGGQKADTIVVIIPIDSPGTTKTVKTHPDSTHVPATRPRGPNPDSPLLSVNQPTEMPKPHLVDTPGKPGKPASVFINSDCHDFATDFDADKLKAKMLEATKDDDRINIARKAFKIKCFHTNQIRGLSEVFASEAARFRFLEIAWPFAADEHFHELSDLLTDPVYNSKFKVMTHGQ